MSVQVKVYLDQKTKDELQSKANQEGRSLSNYIAVVLSRAHTGPAIGHSGFVLPADFPIDEDEEGTESP